jgi:hypothetical protein
MIYYNSSISYKLSPENISDNIVRIIYVFER